MIKGTKNAFTLAEVLITLGIIGVVAAMTMPTLLNSTQGAQYRTAYKKALSVLSQAVVLNVALDDYDLSQASVTDTTKKTDGTSASVYNLFNNRMNVARVCDGECDSSNDRWAANNKANIKFGQDGNYTFFFNDGIALTFKTNDGDCTLGNATGVAEKKCLGAIDVNSKKNPNKIVACDNGTSGDTCKVTNPTDIYPVALYDQTIVPNTKAAQVVLFGGK